MQFEKTEIAKEDGRYLIFYHFPATANHEQNEAFQAAEALGDTSKAAAAPAHNTDDAGACALSGKDGGVV